MRKDILIGSIIAVVILVLVSFTGVVGYQTTKSSTFTKASPLFSVRSNRALDKQSKDFACNYVGKGKSTPITIPKRDGRTASFHKAQRLIDIISKMDDKAFDRLVSSVIKHIHQDNTFKDVNINEVKTTLHHLKNNPKRIDVDYGKNNLKYTWLRDFWATLCWFPFCAIGYVIFYILLFYVIFTICPLLNTFVPL